MLELFNEWQTTPCTLTSVANVHSNPAECRTTKCPFATGYKTTGRKKGAQKLVKQHLSRIFG